jgi:hypothetical protein
MESTKTKTQRDLMRGLFKLHNGDAQRMIADYAAAEQRGEVARRKNESGLDSAAYAAALFKDGEKRGWFTSKAQPGKLPFMRLPEFLNGVIELKQYVRWLQRKAVAHVRRDKKRGNKTATTAEYERAIHDAVCKSGGKDVYTREPLDWTLLSRYDNDASKQGRRVYKAKFALLPTVDHIGDGLGPADFAICAWRTNDAKGDLTLDEFLALCRRVIAANA